MKKTCEQRKFVKLTLIRSTMISDINFIPTWLLSLPCQIGLDLDLPQLLREFVNEHWKTVIMYFGHFLNLFEI
jgi:hypothetical protein